MPEKIFFLLQIWEVPINIMVGSKFFTPGKKIYYIVHDSDFRAKLYSYMLVDRFSESEMNEVIRKKLRQ